MTEQERRQARDAAPLHVFRFEVEFSRVELNEAEGGADSGAESGGGGVRLCGGAFSECSGLEGTMEPKVIKEGGRNYGALQRMGPITFATVVLKRGITRNRDLFHWFSLVGQGAYAYRLNARIRMMDPAGDPVLTWVLARAVPVKFKAADLNARGTEVGVEELHIAHEGLRLET